VNYVHCKKETCFTIRVQLRSEELRTRKTLDMNVSIDLVKYLSSLRTKYDV